MLGELLLTTSRSRSVATATRSGAIIPQQSAAVTSAATTPIPTTGRRFLLSDVYTSHDKRIIIYTTDSFLVELNTPGNITTVFIDGTSIVTPKHFAQLWIIRGFIKGICFPLAYLLPSSRQTQLFLQPLPLRDLHLCPSLLPHTSHA